mmetsp:Transcript_69498/g.199305  ORF Transcript_69498/g.199305 Transcript_69498/m.199305 type:complete len:277 (+) Transcript_69498:1-831(+)
MHAAKGILTSRGGMTSHAAVVARGMGRPCVSGAGALRVDYAAQVMYIGDIVVRAGDMLTIDGTAGEVILGEVPTVPPRMSGDFGTIMKWADALRRMQVRANAETAADARAARDFGAEGIGLVRTEHMFFEGDRIVAMREMILALDEAGRRTALDKLLVECNFPSIAIHSGLNQEERIARYKQFKEFQKRIMVSTDLFGRGIDIERVNIVINYDMPADSDSYLHRVGRAGRFGTKGLALTFVSTEEDTEVLKKVQERFEVNIGEMPAQIDTTSYLNA